MSVSPATFPPPFDWRDFVAEPTDPPDERIDVGVLIVGAGPAGLAAAVRVGQLLEEQPEVREQLGDVPVAVVEKGRSAGAHLLSGAVVNPRALRELFPGMPTEDMPLRAPVVREGVYFLTPKRHVRVPAPPPMWNHNHYVASLSEIGGWLAEQAEELGVTLVPETSARTLLVSGGRVVGIRTGDRGRGKDGDELATFEPGSDIRARVTILAEGTQGHLAGIASERFGLASRPQVYALGVKEVWEVARPLNRVIHTMGWPLRSGKRYREFGGSFIYPLDDDKIALGMVVGLDYTDATLSVHDLLQELKTHPFVRRLLEGGTRVGWGAKTIPEGGFQALPDRLSFPGGMVVGDSAGFVNVPGAQGRPLRDEVGDHGRRGRRRGRRAGGDLMGARRARRLRRGGARQLHLERPAQGAERAAGLQQGLLPRRRQRGDLDHHARQAPARDEEARARRRRARDGGHRPQAYPDPDGKLVFDKLSSVYLSGNKTRDDAPSHIRVDTKVRRELAEAWVHMCPAHVYEVAGEASPAGNVVDVEVTASNCVQCGAISAKGGRLTPPEGGDGPEYTQM